MRVLIAAVVLAASGAQAQSSADGPILGARSVKQLKDNFGVLNWKLTDEQWKCLDEVSAIDLGFPHGFLDGNRYIYGATHPLIDNHRV